MTAALTAAQMKAADRNTITHFGVASLVLQERAALAVCDLIASEAAHMPHAGRGQTVRIYAGSGNNGADAVACARILDQRGFHTVTRLLGDERKRTEEFQTQLKSALAYGCDIAPYTPDAHDAKAEGIPAFVVDGLLGVGANRAPEGTFDTAIREMNRLGEAGAFVIAVDIPSGIDADDGFAAGSAVRADATVTFGFYKTGQLLYPGTLYCGRLIRADIGITEASLLSDKGAPLSVEPEAVCFESPDMVPRTARKPDGNKGTFGKVLLVTGSRTTGGAAILAAQAALKAGCGMVRVFTEKANRDALLAALPEALTDVFTETAFETEETGAVAAREDTLRRLDEAYAWADAVVCGCGTGCGAAAKALLSALLEKNGKPLVLDADALNLLAVRENGLADRAAAYASETAPLVLTPHAAEFARLYGSLSGTTVTAGDCRKNIRFFPRDLAQRLGAIVVYKDARSVAACGKDPLYINLSGNDGMATAGSGDVLAGFLGAFLADKNPDGPGFFSRVQACVYLHGHAGDLAARLYGKRGMTAGSLTDALVSYLRDTEKDV